MLNCGSSSTIVFASVAKISFLAALAFCFYRLPNLSILNLFGRYKRILRLIAAILILAFLSYDIAWAYPDYGRNNLAVTGLQNEETIARMKAGLIVELIEKRSALKDRLQEVNLNDIYFWRNSTEKEFEGVEFKVHRYDGQPIEVRLVLEKEGLVIRYFDPNFKIEAAKAIDEKKINPNLKREILKLADVRAQPSLEELVKEIRAEARSASEAPVLSNEEKLTHCMLSIFLTPIIAAFILSRIHPGRGLLSIGRTTSRQSPRGEIPRLQDFDEKFKCVRFMGGGLSRVFKFQYIGHSERLSNGTHLQNGNVYVVKVARSKEAADACISYQAVILSAINPENSTNAPVPQLVGLVDIENTKFGRECNCPGEAIVLEFIDGRQLHDYAIEMVPQRPPGIRIDLSLRILEGYRQMFAVNGVVHGDIDPFGIMVVEDDAGGISRVVFCDNDSPARVDGATEIDRFRKGLHYGLFTSYDRGDRLRNTDTPTTELCLPRDDVWSLCKTLLFAFDLETSTRWSGGRPGRARNQSEQLALILNKYKDISIERYALDELIAELRGFVDGAITDDSRDSPEDRQSSRGTTTRRGFFEKAASGIAGALWFTRNLAAQEIEGVRVPDEELFAKAMLRPEENAPGMKAISDAVFPNREGKWRMPIELDATTERNPKQKGAAFFDLRPDFDRRGVNLKDKAITLIFRIPDEMRGRIDNPNIIRMFAKSIDAQGRWHTQYMEGAMEGWKNITSEYIWTTLVLEARGSFRPANVASIGFEISAKPGFRHKGNFELAEAWVEDARHAVKRLRLPLEANMAEESQAIRGAIPIKGGGWQLECEFDDRRGHQTGEVYVDTRNAKDLRDLKGRLIIAQVRPPRGFACKDDQRPNFARVFVTSKKEDKWQVQYGRPYHFIVSDRELPIQILHIPTEIHSADRVGVQFGLSGGSKHVFKGRLEFDSLEARPIRTAQPVNVDDFEIGVNTFFPMYGGNLGIWREIRADHMGLSSSYGRNRLVEYLRALKREGSGIRHVRWIGLFADARAGIIQNKDGSFRFDSYVQRDWEAFVEIMKDEEFKDMHFDLCLLDFTIADGVTHERGEDGRPVPVGEHPEFFNDENRDAFLKFLLTFVKKNILHPDLKGRFSIGFMNEPSNVKEVSVRTDVFVTMKRFNEAMAKVAPEMAVTCQFKNRVLAEMFNQLGGTANHYHWYPDNKDGDISAAPKPMQLGKGGTIIGEIPVTTTRPTYILRMLAHAYQAGARRVYGWGLLSHHGNLKDKYEPGNDSVSRARLGAYSKSLEAFRTRVESGAYRQSARGRHEDTTRSAPKGYGEENRPQIRRRGIRRSIGGFFKAIQYLVLKRFSYLALLWAIPTGVGICLGIYGIIHALLRLMHIKYTLYEAKKVLEGLDPQETQKMQELSQKIQEQVQKVQETNLEMTKTIIISVILLVISLLLTTYIVYSIFKPFKKVSDKDIVIEESLLEVEKNLLGEGKERNEVYFVPYADVIITKDNACYLYQGPVLTSHGFSAFGKIFTSHGYSLGKYIRYLIAKGYVNGKCLFGPCNPECATVGPARVEGTKVVYSSGFAHAHAEPMHVEQIIIQRGGRKRKEKQEKVIDMRREVVVMPDIAGIFGGEWVVSEGSMEGVAEKIVRITDADGIALKFEQGRWVLDREYYRRLGDLRRREWRRARDDRRRPDDESKGRQSARGDGDDDAPADRKTYDPGLEEREYNDEFVRETDIQRQGGLVKPARVLLLNRANGQWFELRAADDAIEDRRYTLYVSGERVESSLIEYNLPEKSEAPYEIQEFLPSMGDGRGYGSAILRYLVCKAHAAKREFKIKSTNSAILLHLARKYLRDIGILVPVHSTEPRPIQEVNLLVDLGILLCSNPEHPLFRLITDEDGIVSHSDIEEVRQGDEIRLQEKNYILNVTTGATVGRLSRFGKHFGIVGNPNPDVRRSAKGTPSGPKFSIGKVDEDNNTIEIKIDDKSIICSRLEDLTAIHPNLPQVIHNFATGLLKQPERMGIALTILGILSDMEKEAKPPEPVVEKKPAVRATLSDEARAAFMGYLRGINDEKVKQLLLLMAQATHVGVGLIQVPKELEDMATRRQVAARARVALDEARVKAGYKRGQQLPGENALIFTALSEKPKEDKPSEDTPEGGQSSEEKSGDHQPPKDGPEGRQPSDEKPEGRQSPRGGKHGVARLTHVINAFKHHLFERPGGEGLSVLKTEGFSPLFILMNDHLGAYKGWEIAQLMKILLGPAILIREDAHDDLWNTIIRPRPTTVQEALRCRYGNKTNTIPALYHGIIDEVYLIKHMPVPGAPVTYKASLCQAAYVKDSELGPKIVFLTDQGKTPADYEGRFGGKVEVIRPITVHIITSPDQMPDLNREKEGRPVLWDTDADQYYLVDLNDKSEQNMQEVRRRLALSREYLRRINRIPDVFTFAASSETTAADRTEEGYQCCAASLSGLIDILEDPVEGLGIPFAYDERGDLVVVRVDERFNIRGETDSPGGKSQDDQADRKSSRGSLEDRQYQIPDEFDDAIKHQDKLKRRYNSFMSMAWLSFIQNACVFLITSSLLIDRFIFSRNVVSTSPYVAFITALAGAGAFVYSIFWIWKTREKKAAYMVRVGSLPIDREAIAYELVPLVPIFLMCYSFLLNYTYSLHLKIIGPISIAIALAYSIILRYKKPKDAMKEGKLSVQDVKKRFYIFEGSRKALGILNLVAAAISISHIWALSVTLVVKLPVNFIIMNLYILAEYVHNFIFQLSSPQYGYLWVGWPIRKLAWLLGVLTRQFMKLIGIEPVKHRRIDPFGRLHPRGGIIGKEIKRLRARLKAATSEVDTTDDQAHRRSARGAGPKEDIQALIAQARAFVESNEAQLGDMSDADSLAGVLNRWSQERRLGFTYAPEHAAEISQRISRSEDRKGNLVALLIRRTMLCRFEVALGEVATCFEAVSPICETSASGEYDFSSLRGFFGQVFRMQKPDQPAVSHAAHRLCASLDHWREYGQALKSDPRLVVQLRNGDSYTETPDIVKCQIGILTSLLEDQKPSQAAVDGIASTLSDLLQYSTALEDPRGTITYAFGCLLNLHHISQERADECAAALKESGNDVERSMLFHLFLHQNPSRVAADECTRCVLDTMRDPERKDIWLNVAILNPIFERNLPSQSLIEEFVRLYFEELEKMDKPGGRDENYRMRMELWSKYMIKLLENQPLSQHLIDLIVNNLASSLRRFSPVIDYGDIHDALSIETLDRVETMLAIAFSRHRPSQNRVDNCVTVLMERLRNPRCDIPLYREGERLQHEPYLTLPETYFLTELLHLIFFKHSPGRKLIGGSPQVLLQRIQSESDVTQRLVSMVCLDYLLLNTAVDDDMRRQVIGDVYRFIFHERLTVGTMASNLIESAVIDPQSHAISIPVYRAFYDIVTDRRDIPVWTEAVPRGDQVNVVYTARPLPSDHPDLLAAVKEAVPKNHEIGLEYFEERPSLRDTHFILCVTEKGNLLMSVYNHKGRIGEMLKNEDAITELVRRRSIIGGDGVVLMLGGYSGSVEDERIPGMLTSDSGHTHPITTEVETETASRPSAGDRANFMRLVRLLGREVFDEAMRNRDGHRQSARGTTIRDAGEVPRAASHPARVFEALADVGEGGRPTAEDMAGPLGLTGSTVEHSMRTLRQLHLVTRTGSGIDATYALTPEARRSAAEVARILREGLLRARPSEDEIDSIKLNLLLTLQNGTDLAFQDLRAGDRALASNIVRTFASEVLPGDDIERIKEYLRQTREMLNQLIESLSTVRSISRRLQYSDDGIVRVGDMEPGARFVLLSNLQFVIRPKTDALVASMKSRSLGLSIPLPVEDGLRLILNPLLYSIVDTLNNRLLEMLNQNASLRRQDLRGLLRPLKQLRSARDMIDEYLELLQQPPERAAPEHPTIQMDSKAALLRASTDLLMRGNVDDAIVAYLPESMDVGTLLRLILSLFSVKTKEEAEEMFDKGLISILGFGRAQLYIVKKVDGEWMIERELTASRRVFRTSKHLELSPASYGKLWALRNFEGMATNGEPLVLHVPKRSAHFVGRPGHVTKRYFVDRGMFHKDAEEFSPQGKAYPGRAEERLYVGVADPITGEISYLLTLDNFQIPREKDETRSNPLFGGREDKRKKVKFISIITQLMVLALNRLRLDEEVESVLNLRSGAHAISEIVHDIKNSVSNLRDERRRTRGARGTEAIGEKSLETLDRALKELEEACYAFMGKAGDWQRWFSKKGGFSWKRVRENLGALDEESLDILSDFFREMFVCLNQETDDRVNDIIMGYRARFEGNRALQELITELSNEVIEEIKLRKRIKRHTGAVRHVYDDLRQKIEGVQRLYEDMALKTPGAEIAREIQALYGRLNEQVRELLNLVHGEIFKPEMHIERIDIVRFIDDILSESFTVGDAEAFGQDRDPVFTIQVEGDIPSVLADRRHLRKSLEELLMNAKKYGGTKVRVRISSQEDKVIIEIADTGRGMSRKVKSRIFEPGYRSREVKREKIPGSGLGLLYAKQNIEGMGGTLDIDSKGPGRGSASIVTLRSFIAAHPKTGPPKPESSRRQSSRGQETRPLHKDPSHKAILPAHSPIRQIIIIPITIWILSAALAMLIWALSAILMPGKSIKRTEHAPPTPAATDFVKPDTSRRKSPRGGSLPASRDARKILGERLDGRTFVISGTDEDGESYPINCIIEFVSGEKRSIINIRRESDKLLIGVVEIESKISDENEIEVIWMFTMNYDMANKVLFRYWLESKTPTWTMLAKELITKYGVDPTEARKLASILNDEAKRLVREGKSAEAPDEYKRAWQILLHRVYGEDNYQHHGLMTEVYKLMAEAMPIDYALKAWIVNDEIKDRYLGWFLGTFGVDIPQGWQALTDISYSAIFRHIPCFSIEVQLRYGNVWIRGRKVKKYTAQPNLSEQTGGRRSSRGVASLAGDETEPPSFIEEDEVRQLREQADSLLPGGSFGWKGKKREVIIEEILASAIQGLGPADDYSERLEHVRSVASAIVSPNPWARLKARLRVAKYKGLSYQARTINYLQDHKKGYLGSRIIGIGSFGVGFLVSLIRGTFLTIGMRFDSSRLKGVKSRRYEAIFLPCLVPLPMLRAVAAHEFCHVRGIKAGANAFAALRLEEHGEDVFQGSALKTILIFSLLSVGTLLLLIPLLIEAYYQYSPSRRIFRKYKVNALEEIANLREKPPSLTRDWTRLGELSTEKLWTYYKGSLPAAVASGFVDQDGLPRQAAYDILRLNLSRKQTSADIEAFGLDSELPLPLHVAAEKVKSYYEHERSNQTSDGAAIRQSSRGVEDKRKLWNSLSRFGIIPGASVRKLKDLGDPANAQQADSIERFRSLFEDGDEAYPFYMELQPKNAEEATRAMTDPRYASVLRTVHAKHICPREDSEESIIFNLSDPDVIALIEDEDSALYQIVKTIRPRFFSVHIGFAVEKLGRVFLVKDRSTYVAESPLMHEEVAFRRIVDTINTLKINLRRLGFSEDQILIESLDYKDDVTKGAYDLICEPKFIKRVLDATGVGLLIDCGHLLISAENLPGYRDRPYMDYVREIVNQDTIARVREVHLAVPEYVEELQWVNDSHLSFAAGNGERERVLEILRYILQQRQIYARRRGCPREDLVTVFETSLDDMAEDAIEIGAFLDSLPQEEPQPRQSPRGRSSKKVWPQSLYDSLNTPANAEESPIDINGYIDAYLPERMIDDLEGGAKLEVHVGLHEDTKRYIDTLRSRRLILEAEEVYAKRYARDGDRRELKEGVDYEDIEEHFYLVRKKNGDVVYILGGVHRGSRLMEYLAMFKFKGIPRQSVSIRDYDIDYRAIYREALEGKTEGVGQCVIVHRPQKFIAAMARVNRAIEYEDVGREGFNCFTVTVPDKKRLLIVDLRDAYGDQITEVMDYVIKDLGIRDILFVGLCGGLGSDMGVGDIVLYDRILNVGGRRVKAPINKVSAARLEEVFGTQREIHPASCGANTPAICVEKKGDMRNWVNWGAGFVEMELLHIARFLRRHKDINFGAILRVTDLPGTQESLGQEVTSRRSREIRRRNEEWRRGIAQYIISEAPNTGRPSSGETVKGRQSSRGKAGESSKVANYMDAVHEVGLELTKEVGKLNHTTAKWVIPINVDTLPAANGENNDVLKSFLEILALKLLQIKRRYGYERYGNRIRIQFVRIDDEGKLVPVTGPHDHKIFEIYHDLDIVKGHDGLKALSEREREEEDFQYSFLITDINVLKALDRLKKPYKETRVLPLEEKIKLHRDDDGEPHLYMWHGVLDIAIAQTILLSQEKEVRGKYYAGLLRLYKKLLKRDISESDIMALFEDNIPKAIDMARCLAIPPAERVELESLRTIYELMRKAVLEAA